MAEMNEAEKWNHFRKLEEGPDRESNLSDIPEIQ
jgi:hypothetical protein